MHARRFNSALAALATAFALVSCSSDKTGDCPTITGITDASIATVFKPGGTPDQSNVLYTAELTDVNGDCDIDKKAHTADASLQVSFRATRAPSGAEAHYTIPYFVAVTEGARILARHVYSVKIDFEPGQTVATASDRIGSTHLETATDKQPYDYQILVGLELSKAQLDYNRQNGHYSS